LAGRRHIIPKKRLTAAAGTAARAWLATLRTGKIMRQIAGAWHIRK